VVEEEGASDSLFSPSTQDLECNTPNDNLGDGENEGLWEEEEVEDDGFEALWDHMEGVDHPPGVERMQGDHHGGGISSEDDMMIGVCV
jgi:hypothetical protein